MAASASTCNSSFISIYRKPLSPFLSPHLFQTLKPHLHKTPNPTIHLQNPTTTHRPISAKSSPSDLPLSTDPSRPNTLKSRLAGGETLYGIFLLSFSPTIAEIAGLAGYDFAVVDMEHGHGGVSSALPCLHALAATGTPAILRLPESSPTWAKKALDLGPQGIMFPMIEGPKSARKAVSYCHFPPDGVRGSAHPVVRASKYGIDDGYLQNYKEELLIMCQVETVDGVEKAAEIAAVDGVDAIQMGPLDLSASVGYLWDPGHKKVRGVLREAEKAVLGSSEGKKGAFMCGFAMPHDPPEELRNRGYHMVSGTVDTGLFRSAAVEDVQRFKSCLKSEIVEEEEEDKKYWSE
ncbi:hypothetical protein MRB53_014294 [Persea americana]|uniref:Uncharacterized protein n=1 Tax=Persea americana TaxID=3435 RepID=A0ACC2KAM9_PERAE|nr:hypothetical protein MRB53_014294 [Persea americana]